MATKLQKAMEDSLTFEVPQTEKKYKGPTVRIFLPELEGDESEGLKVDQYEHVTIANEEKDEVYYIHRGEYVDVPVPVFMVLKEKYPKL